MKRKIVIWVIAGFLVASLWALYLAATLPSPLISTQPIVWTLINITNRTISSRSSFQPPRPLPPDHPVPLAGGTSGPFSRRRSERRMVVSSFRGRAVRRASHDSKRSLGRFRFSVLSGVPEDRGSSGRSASESEDQDLASASANREAYVLSRSHNMVSGG
jgi:hypothetical protein